MRWPLVARTRVDEARLAQREYDDELINELVRVYNKDLTNERARCGLLVRSLDQQQELNLGIKTCYKAAREDRDNYKRQLDQVKADLAKVFLPESPSTGIVEMDVEMLGKCVVIPTYLVSGGLAALHTWAQKEELPT